MMERYNVLAGGLFGLLVGDALGVPYEFHAPESIPPLEQIDMTPPPGFRRTYRQVPPGTWSDDGAQALCLLDSLASCGRFSLEDFAKRLSDWYENGFWAVDGIVFDVGIQTEEALRAYQRGVPPEQCGLVRPDGKGNGSLMRTLPLALWHRGTDAELVEDAHRQCQITHGHVCNQVCCALYCLAARFLMAGEAVPAALTHAVRALRDLYRDRPDYAQELEWSVRPDDPWEGKGSGYVVDSLRGAFMILEQAPDYASAVRQAVSLGQDTDTTACIAGGLAGLRFGLTGIPALWLETLRERDRAEALLRRAFPEL